MKRYVVIGASIAGLNGIDVLRKLDKESEIVLISDEAEIYSKCIMHYYMNGSRARKELSFVNDQFMEQNHVIWKKGHKAVSIDTSARTVELDDNSKISYDELLIATGSHAFIPPIDGLEDTKNVYPFHSLEDCDIIMEKAANAANIVILGAGLVGVDVAEGLLHIAGHMTIIDLKEHMLSLQLDARAASVYEKKFKDYGVEQIYGVSVHKVVKNNGGFIEKVILSDGTELDCDLLIISSGTRANVDLLKGTGLELDKLGLLIDSSCRTNISHVYGAGDVTGRNMVWPMAAKEAMVAAFNMAGIDRSMTDFFDGKSTINIFGIPTMAYGIPDALDQSYTVEIKEGRDGSYQKLIHKDGIIYGVILQGNLHFSGILNQLISSKPDLTKVSKPLLDMDYGDLLCLGKREV